MAEDLTAGWRREGARLCFCVEPGCGDGYSFALDRPGAGGEFQVVRRDALDGDESPVAESFAGFLAVRTALALGLRDGPTPAVARLWRSTPGALLANGVLAYGPHLIGERNETFEVRRYAADWVLVGDDGGAADCSCAATAATARACTASASGRSGRMWRRRGSC
ncbi:hypothetical protein HFP72_02135 [Nocardiopsis sp. ARC36]